ncbi:hypothetical protein F9278_20985 [Streptomyces phaeolivaceus]|uniref:Uncharacterized protein n=1 Tax=Streptomyces phaeolivaceus TaxID=2653200 RepID=A0A5P8K5A6_9ACTN|nr:hypothetical protein [Streptomyces phaeolivaceus]QFQ98261.1 hypothetical protein F9278_20985 [Streptomyces phaeolivaceus]
MDRHDGQTEEEGGESASGEAAAPRKYEKDRIAEHVIGHVVGGSIVGVMAWFWTQTPIGFVMTVIWGAGVYGWNKSPQVQAWSRRRRIRLGVAITAAYWTLAFLVM